MNKPIPLIIKLSNTDPSAVVSKAVITNSPYPDGVILIGDREAKCIPTELVCATKELSAFERFVIGIPDEYTYILTPSEPVIPFAPDFKFVFDTAKFIQVQPRV